MEGDGDTRMSSHTIMNGEPVEYTPEEFTWEACCDCSLAHFVAYIYDKKKNVIIKQCYRDDWKTKEIRLTEFNIEDIQATIKTLRTVIQVKKREAKRNDQERVKERDRKA